MSFTQKSHFEEKSILYLNLNGISRSEDYSRRRRQKKSRKEDKSESRSKREKRAESGEIVDNESGKETSPVGRPHPLANKLTSILPEEIPSDGRSNL